MGRSASQEPEYEEQQDESVSDEEKEQAESLIDSKLPERNQDLDDVLEVIGYGPYQRWMFFLCCVGAVCDAMEVASISVLVPVWQIEWDLNDTQVALISGASSIGMLIGATGGGYVSDKFGRRPIFQYSLIVSSIFGIASAIAPSYETFLVFRAFVGLGYGANIVADLNLYMEFLPTKGRGYYFLWIEVVWAVASISSICITWLIQPDYGWRWPIAIFVLPAILVIIFRRNTPESPRWLYYSGQKEKAEKVLRMVAENNGTAINIHLCDPPEKMEATYGELCATRGPTMIALMTVWGLFNLGNSLAFWLPKFAGFEKGEDLSDDEAQTNSYVLALAIDCVKLSFALAMVYVIEQWDRLPLLKSGLLLSGLATFTLSFLYGYDIWFLVGVCFFEAGKDISIEVIYTYTPELFPTSMRATAMGMTQASYRTAHVVGPFVVSSLKDVSFTLMMAVMASFYLVACIIVQCSLTIETKDCALLEADDANRNELNETCWCCYGDENSSSLAADGDDDDDDDDAHFFAPNDESFDHLDANAKANDVGTISRRNGANNSKRPSLHAPEPLPL